VARASSDRNLIALTGEYWSRQGQLLEAEAQYRRAAEHRWKKQGGAFLLDWANVLEALGRSDEAVRALQQCVTQDPETPSAAEARKRVQAVAVPG
jgi:tetratricopeptide (TPR) repeat protein